VQENAHQDSWRTKATSGSDYALCASAGGCSSTPSWYASLIRARAASRTNRHMRWSVELCGWTHLTRFCLAGCADFTVSYFHFLSFFPAKKSVQKGEVGLDPRAGYFFQRNSVPPRSPLHYQLENGGAIRQYSSYASYQLRMRSI
jgi:hypothetical protein